MVVLVNAQPMVNGKELPVLNVFWVLMETLVKMEEQLQVSHIQQQPI